MCHCTACSQSGAQAKSLLRADDFKRNGGYRCTNSAKGDAIMSHIIELKNIILSYDGDRILDNVSLDIEDGQFVTLLGPSG